MKYYPIWSDSISIYFSLGRNGPAKDLLKDEFAAGLHALERMIFVGWDFGPENERMTMEKSNLFRTFSALSNIAIWVAFMITLRSSNIAMENGPFLKMYLLLKDGDVRACHVSLQGVPFFNWATTT